MATALAVAGGAVLCISVLVIAVIAGSVMTTDPDYRSIMRANRQREYMRRQIRVIEGFKSADQGWVVRRNGTEQ